MRTALIDSLVAALIKNGVIAEAEKELYSFGINQLILLVVNIGTSLVIGAVFGMLWQSILFSAAYIPLRRYAGGYHAETPGKCYCLSVLLIVCVLIMLRFWTFSGTGALALLAIAGLIIFIKAPVQSKNKPLSNKEKRVYRLRARLILSAEILGIIALSFINLEIANCIGIAIFSAMLMLIVPGRGIRY